MNTHGQFDDLALLDMFVQKTQAKERGYCPHTPHAKQREFLALDCKNALYGGAAGGGKSNALLMAALQYVHIPCYSALILRRSYKDLNMSDAIMARAKEWLKDTDAVWSAEAHRWTFPSGATLEFGFFDHADHKDKYQGGAWQFIGIDEVTQWPSGWASYLFSRLRKPSEGPLSKVPLRFRCATNPGGIGHEWVYRKYVNKKTADAPFIPAMLDDNPHLDKESYRESLAELDATTRAQLERGVWVRDASGLVYHFNETTNFGGLPNDIRYPWDHILALDFGVSNATSFTVIAYRAEDPKVYVRRSFKAVGMITDDVAEVIERLEYTFRFSKIVGDIGGLGKLYVEELRRRFSIAVEAAEKTNKLGYIKLLNSALEKSRVVIVDPQACKDLVDEWTTLPWADDTQQKEAEGFANHCSDGMLYGFRACPNYNERKSPPKKTYEETLEAYQHHERESDFYEPKQFWEEGSRWSNGGRE